MVMFKICNKNMKCLAHVQWTVGIALTKERDFASLWKTKTEILIEPELNQKSYLPSSLPLLSKTGFLIIVESGSRWLLPLATILFFCFWLWIAFIYDQFRVGDFLFALAISFVVLTILGWKVQLSSELIISPILF